MSARKSTLFYGVLIALASLVAGMVIASRLDLTTTSTANVNVPAANTSPISGPLDATTFRRIADAASPSVVSIRTLTMRQTRGAQDLFGLQNPFGGRRQPPSSQRVPGAGSGFIIDKAGFILTNNHVVEDASSIEIALAGMAELEPGLPAKLVGRDPLTDSALLQLTRLPDQPLTEAKFGDSTQIGPGDWVMAIGNPFRLSNTVTVGVVSAVSRQQQTAINGRSEEMIQTDAAINRGNSGGPLLNLRGEVVGINTMIVSDESGGNLGIGFAIPINNVAEILPQLRKGKVLRGLIGVGLSAIPITRDDAQDLGLPGSSGSTVSSVTAGGPAADSGLKIGDVIVEFNGKPVKDNSSLVGMVTRTTPGTTVPMKVVRAKKTLSLNVRVAEYDVQQEQEAQAQAQTQQNILRPTETGLDMTIDRITPQIARQLDLPAGATGAVVTEVEPGGAAALNGVRPGDVIKGVNDQPTATVDQVNAALGRIASGRLARLLILRGGQEVLVQVRKP